MSVEPYDEPELNAEDIIIRRVDPQQHIVFDENRGRNRISSKLFSPSSGSNSGMSVDVLKLIEQDDINPQQYVTTPKYTASVQFPVSAVRSVGLMVGYEPLSENPYHGEVWGNKRPNKFSSSQKRAISAASTWYVDLPNVDIK